MSDLLLAGAQKFCVAVVKACSVALIGWVIDYALTGAPQQHATQILVFH